jgi:ribosomal protein S27E
MGHNVALAEKRKRQFHIVACLGCDRYRTLPYGTDYCKRCRDLKGITQEAYRHFERVVCKGCLNLTVVKIGHAYCKKCNALKAKEVLGTGRGGFTNLYEQEPSLEERLESIRILPRTEFIREPPPPPLSPAWKVIRFIERNDTYLLLSFWALICVWLLCQR